MNPAALFVILSLACGHALGGIFSSIKTVDELDLTQYAGRWYEIYNSLIQRLTFEKNAVCVTADYTLNPDGTVKVFNAQRVKTPTGPASNITGVATVPDPKQPGKLTVQFPGSPRGNYWVVKLGPVINGQYQYTIITAPYKLFLWVLARDPKEYQAKYDQEVKEYIKANGYTWFLNKPRATEQGDTCIYPPLA